jgi:hypothetical protein
MSFKFNAASFITDNETSLQEKKQKKSSCKYKEVGRRNDNRKFLQKKI